MPHESADSNETGTDRSRLSTTEFPSHLTLGWEFVGDGPSANLQMFLDAFDLVGRGRLVGDFGDHDSDIGCVGSQVVMSNQFRDDLYNLVVG